MQMCTQCNIKISTETDRCPLCHGALSASHQHHLIQTYPVDPPAKRKRRWIIRTVSVAALISIAISVAVNVLTWSGTLWCVVLSACVVYAWLMGWITCRRKVHVGLKLLGHALSISLLLVVVNAFAFNAKPFHQITWSVSYAMPIVLICFTAAISIVMVIQKQRMREYLLYQFVLCLMVLIPLILVLCGVTNPMIPSIVAAGWSCVTTIILVLFARKTVVLEFGRMFHI